MKTFATGLIAGAMIGVGMSMLVNPVDKKDLRKVKCKTNRMIRGISSAINNFM